MDTSSRELEKMIDNEKYFQFSGKKIFIHPLLDTSKVWGKRSTPRLLAARVGENLIFPGNFQVNNVARNNGNKSDIKSRQMCVIFHHISKLRQVGFTHFFHIRWNEIFQKAPATRIMFLPQK